MGPCVGCGGGVALAGGPLSDTLRRLEAAYAGCPACVQAPVMQSQERQPGKEGGRVPGLRRQVFPAAGPVAPLPKGLLDVVSFPECKQTEFGVGFQSR